MENVVLTYHEKVRLLMKTKEIYVKQYTACLLNNKKRISKYYEPVGMCACFFSACSKCGYPFNPSCFYIHNLIPEWDRKFAYQVSPLDVLTGCDYSSLTCGYWFPIWDKARRVNFLNWLINRYTKLSTMIY